MSFVMLSEYCTALESIPGLTPYLPHYRSDSADAVNCKLHIDKLNDSSAGVGPPDGGDDGEDPSCTGLRPGPWLDGDPL